MSLDRNLFTLTVVPNQSDPTVQDVALPSGAVYYHKQREGGASYRINLFDPMSQSMLSSATAPHASSRHKTIELYNPSQAIEFKSTGTLTFRWCFDWHEHKFEWKKEECYLIRKPDPAVLVAITKDLPGKLKTSTIQILDYNLNRFEIADRKGLEITILTTLLTFQDLNATNNAPLEPQSETPPIPPPRPAPKTGIDRIAEMHAMRYEPNEVTINEEGSVEDYGEYAEGLLADDAMLFITVRSASAADVPRVLQVVEHVKRLRHKREVTVGKPSEELHQYVVYDTQPTVPQRIKLDGPPSNSYKPPSSLSVHLSKIPMPELRPLPISQKPPKPPAIPPKGRTTSSGSPPRNTHSIPRTSPAPATPPGRHSTPSPQPQHGTTAAKTGNFWGRPRK